MEDNYFGIQLPGGSVVSIRSLNNSLRRPMGMVVYNAPDTLRLPLRFVNTVSMNRMILGQGSDSCHFDTTFILPVAAFLTDTLIIYKQQAGGRFWLQHHLPEELPSRMQKAMRRVKWMLRYDYATGVVTGRRIFGKGSLDLFFDSRVRCNRNRWWREE